MTHVRKRLLLASATLGAFAVGMVSGAILTFGPDPDTRLAGVEGDTVQTMATPIEGQRLILAADLRDRSSPDERVVRGAKDELSARAADLADAGQISVGDGQLAITANARAEGRAATSADAFDVKATLPKDSILPPNPALLSDAETASIATVAKAALTPRPWKSERVQVRRGDSLTTILKRAGIDGRQVHSAIRSLKGVYDPRGLRIGQELIVTAADRENKPAQLLSVALDLNFDHQLLITRDADGAFTTKTIEQAKRRELVHRAGDIEGSLYLSAMRSAVPNDVVGRLIHLFSWDVDFQRDIRRGDRFETLYEEVTLERDSKQTKGELLYAGLTVRGKLVDAYLFAPNGGLPTYYDSEGRSLRKFLLRTPIDGARLSSHFGMRKHPVLGYSKMHKGTDFAAPRGTPIYAGGGGKIDFVGVKGGYGNFIRIRHSDTWSTAYAHMHNFAKGMKRGKRVRQGDVIGYVGTTGRSTGNHLHYEVLMNGKQVNPMKMKQPPAASLKGTELAAFQKERARIDAARKDLAQQRYLTSRATTEVN